MGRMLDRVLPPALGTPFRWLFTGFASKNLADGILLSAGPLLVASLTLDPLAVALAVFVQRLPWVVFGLVAGAIIDRVDRIRLIVLVNLLRVVVVLGLAATVATGTVNLAIVYVVSFVLGSAETFADNAARTLVPTVVPSGELGLANARRQGVGIVANQLAGPPIGALLFGLAAAVPFGINAVLFLVAVAAFRRVELPPPGERPPRRELRSEVAEGLRWMWGHRPVRTLMLLITTLNVTFGAANAIWVLYALERLRIGEFGFGLLLSATAVGGLVGSLVYGPIERRLSYATMLRIGLVIETVHHFALAATTTAWVAALVLVAFGVHAVVWGTLDSTIRQRAVPGPLLGRMESVYMLGALGGIVVGSVIGGALAQRFGVLAAFWFGGIGSALALVIGWRAIDNVAEAGERPAVASVEE